MSCPFRRMSSQGPTAASGKAAPLQRQSSVQPSSAIDNEVAVPEDTLNLKHLSDAIQLLTSPANEKLQEAVESLLLKNNNFTRFLDKLPKDVDNNPNYDYLEDVRIAVSSEEGIEGDQFIYMIGEEIITIACRNRVTERALKALGPDLRGFLATLDGVHDVLQLQQTQSDQTDAGFVCAGPGELLFTTDRPTVASLLVGCLRAVAYLLYNTKVEVQMHPTSEDPRTFSVQKKLIIDDICPESVHMRKLSTNANDLQIGVASFCKAFPWHFIMDRKLELVQLGAGFARVFGADVIRAGRRAENYFRFVRPCGLAMNFQEIKKRTNTPFVVALEPPPGRGQFPVMGLELKGQMVFCPESDCLMFAGSPFLNGLEGLTGRGLFLSDIPLHDATRDVILVGEQARAQDGLRRRMDKLKNSIEEANLAVDKEREKNVCLLHLIFPPDIAKKLWLGEAIEAKTHDNVSMLFSDIVGFTSICSTATPMMVIAMLQSLYNQFDIICGNLDVYKHQQFGMFDAQMSPQSVYPAVTSRTVGARRPLRRVTVVMVPAVGDLLAATAALPQCRKLPSRKKHAVIRHWDAYTETAA
ncbi:head-specific guanylate cyclase-like [Ctenocephalides felis]|uniref:head-specific guanylate cyclase-like n=1 Tax=Ctenocephalides felis TaxID=7515 RepID=UPI000E6E4544|nr:head-specific guanylate cyclase-like [Ctenocephalides felis]